MSEQGKCVQRWKSECGTMIGDDEGRYVDVNHFESQSRAISFNKKAMKRAGQHVARCRAELAAKDEEINALRIQVDKHQQRDDEACVALGSACCPWEIVERIKALKSEIAELRDDQQERDLEVITNDARIAELEAELASLKRIEVIWDKACDIAESHLQGYVNVGDSLFNGIPKMAAERDELRSALAASKAREGEAVMLLDRAKLFIVLARARSSWDSEKSAADDLRIDVDEFITSLKEKRDE